MFAKDAVVRVSGQQKKRDVLLELSRAMAGVYDLDGKSLSEELLKRESIVSTGLGENVAIPHCYLEGIDAIYLFFGLCEEGLDFSSVDGQKVTHIVVVVSPPGYEADYLSVIAYLARILRRKEKRDLLLRMPSDEIVRTITAGIR